MGSFCARVCSVNYGAMTIICKAKLGCELAGIGRDEYALGTRSKRTTLPVCSSRTADRKRNCACWRNAANRRIRLNGHKDFIWLINGHSSVTRRGGRSYRIPLPPQQWTPHEPPES